MSNLPLDTDLNQSDKPDFGQEPEEPTQSFIDHWTDAGRSQLAVEIWKVRLWLSGFPPEDYELRREHIAKGYGCTLGELDDLRNFTFDEKRELVVVLSQEDYEAQRKSLGERFGLRVSVLDDWRRDAKESAKAGQKEKTKEKPQEPPPPFPVDEPWPEAVDLSAVLTEIREEVLAAHMAMDDWQVKLIAPWIALTYYRDDEELWYAPLLGISSPVLQCGKSRLLGLIQKLCHNSLPVSSISPAAIYRAVDKWHPTLFYDELDAVFSRKGENEELRAVFNSGYSRDFPFVVRCAERTHEPEAFNGFGFKAFAGIGEAPATVRDRAILIPLARRPAGVHVRRIDRKELHLKSAEIRRKLLRWSQDNRGVFSHALDMDVEDRLRDNLEPLMCLAERAGAGEADSLRAAIAELTKTENEDSSAGIRLLTAIRPIIEDVEKITSTELIMRLCEAEDSEWKERGRKREEITPRALAGLLKPFGVTPRTMRFDGKTAKGYVREIFQDAFSRYLSVTSVTSLETKDLAPISIGNKSRNVTDRKPGKPFRINDVTDVTNRNAEIRGKKKEKELFTDLSHEQDAHITAAFGLHLPEVEAGEQAGDLRRLLLELETEISEGRMTKAEAKPILWEAFADKIGAPCLDRWWKTPTKELPPAHLNKLANAGVMPPGIFSAEAWDTDRSESGPEGIIHRRTNGKTLGPPTK